MFCDNCVFFYKAWIDVLPLLKSLKTKHSSIGTLCLRWLGGVISNLLVNEKVQKLYWAYTLQSVSVSRIFWIFRAKYFCLPLNNSISALRLRIALNLNPFAISTPDLLVHEASNPLVTGRPVWEGLWLWFLTKWVFWFAIFKPSHGFRFGAEKWSELLIIAS